jgi:hypothetical protein
VSGLFEVDLLRGLPTAAMLPPTRYKVRLRVPALVTLAAASAVAGAAQAASGPPDIRAYKPEADTYVSSSRPRTNFGERRVLRVDGAPETTAFLRFELGRHDEREAEIASVTLLLHSTTAGRASYAVRRVHRNDWRERRLTFDNAPRRSQRYVSSAPVRRRMWSAVDVTAFVERRDRELSLAITTRSTREIAFGSRESRYGPRLVVQYERGEDDGRELVRDLVRRR